MPKKKKDDDAEGGDVMDLLSDQSVSMLEGLVDLGIYGGSVEEVAARFVDERLQDMAGAPEFVSE